MVVFYNFLGIWSENKVFIIFIMGQPSLLRTLAVNSHLHLEIIIYIFKKYNYLVSCMRTVA